MSIPLDDRIGAAMAVGDFLPRARQLAHSLAQLHAGGALQLDRDLRYIAPEQTGRTGRPVDARSDLYSLGATFYHMLAGTPPFSAGDRVEQVHAHLARRPRPLHQGGSGIPAVLSGIVMKLLEKEPDRRYQGAQALVADLDTALAQWSRTGRLENFALAASEIPRRLPMPAALYGRAAEESVLRDTFDKARAGRSGLALVGGAAGIGKSALIRRLDQHVGASGGFFASGKFDLLQRSVPYSGLLQALRVLVLQLLTEPEAALAQWRERILAAAGLNGRILIDMMPEIEGIIGRQPAVTELGPVESKNRFQQIITDFVKVLARPRHPLVLFLDDLQWADGASLELIEYWLVDAVDGSLLVVGAYRDDDIGPAHPLARLRTSLREARVPLPEVQLAPLATADVADLLADTLDQDRARCRPLAELVVRKTGGNPFFILRLLHALHGDGLIRFDAASHAWQWDMQEVGDAPVSDNVLVLMEQAIGRLPGVAGTMLQTAACIGYRFDLDVLADVMGQAGSAALQALEPALDDGLLLPVHDAYMPGSGEAPVVLRFIHDRVQQAAYSLLDKARRSALHLDIGRSLLRRAGGELDASLFDVIDQFDLGAAHITDPAERLRVAELNLHAGRKAKASAAYQAAFDYLKAGQQLLGEAAWRAHPALSVALHRELAESAYLAGWHAQADAIVDAALDHAPSTLDRADLYSLRVLAATVAGDWAGALRWGREGLDVFGQAWPLEGLAAANEAEARAVVVNLGGRRIEMLVEQAEVSDDATRACMRLLSLLGPPAYFSGSEVLPFLVARGVNLALLHGPSVYSSYAFVFHGALHDMRTGEYDVGYAFGQLALALAQRFGNRAEESRTVEVFGLVVHAWIAPVRDSLPLMQEGHRAGVQSGELAYAAFNLCGILINGLPSGVPLDRLLADAAVAIDFGTRCRNRTAVEISLPFRQFARALTGLTPGLGNFNDAGFDEARFLDEARGNQTATGQYWVARLHAAFLAGDIDAALDSSRKAADCIQAGILGMITVAEHSFLTALALAARHADATAPEREALATEIHRLQAQVAGWARYCPANFLHKDKLLQAEMARLADAPWQATELFGEAVDAARENGFIQDEALANELAAAFFRGRGQARIAAMYLGAAIDCYRAWGASAKAQALEAAHGQAGAPQVPDPAASAGASTLALDALGIIKASQAISAENAPERLFTRILQVVIEVAGAETGTLLLDEQGKLMVRARVAADQDSAHVPVNLSLSDDRGVPESLARYVVRTRDALVLADAAAEGAFAADAQVQGLRLRSILCVPLKKQGQVVGLIYLENAALAGAFTVERVEVVQALASQAVISLENSSLIGERERAGNAARFLARAGAVLAESLDHADTLARVAELAVPDFADWCVLDLIDADGGQRRVQAACADDGDAIQAPRQFAPVPAWRWRPPAQVLADGSAVLLRELPDAWLDMLSHEAGPDGLVRAIAPGSLIAVPLVARGRRLGALSFLSARSGRAYDDADLAVARQLADRCALAMDNATLYEEAQDAVRVREDFLAVASHELKTPLTPLLLQTHMMERRMPQMGLDEQGAAWLAKSLGTLKRQGRRLDRLVNELLDISRIAGGQLQLKPEAVDLAQLIRDAVARLDEGGEITQSGSTLTLGGAEGLVGHWDHLRLEQVMINLLTNALKYGEGNPVEVKTHADGGNAIVTVTDHGVGIDPEHLQRIFGRFERAVSARQYGGLGLGLYIASQIVTAMHGRITVASEPGRGSVFTLTLPLSPGAVPS